MILAIEIEQEEDGRWIAEIVELPGVVAYGVATGEARARVKALALRVVAERLDHGEESSDFPTISFRAAGSSGAAFARGRSWSRCSGLDGGSSGSRAPISYCREDEVFGLTREAKAHNIDDPTLDHLAPASVSRRFQIERTLRRKPS